MNDGQTGQRPTRGHRSTQDRLDNFNTIPPVRVDGRGHLYLEKLRGIPDMTGDETKQEVRAILAALIRALRERGDLE